jgi:hypothetical protein
LLLLLSLVGGIALVPHYLVPFLPGIALVIGIALTSWPPAWGSRQLGPLQLLVWGRVAAVAVLVTAAVGLADSSAVEPPTEHSFADARALSLELEGFGVSDLRTAACRIRAPQRFHLLAGLATELPAGDLSMACDPDAEDLLVIHSVTPPGKDYPEGWRAIRSGEQWLHIIPRRPHLDWHGARRSGSEGYVAVSPGLDPTCHTPAMPVVYGMCDHDLGSDVALRVPVQASHPEAMNVVVLTGRHRATTHVAVTRHADKLDIHWIPGIPGRFDVLGLPLVVLLGPDEEQLEVLLRE